MTSLRGNPPRKAPLWKTLLMGNRFYGHRYLLTFKRLNIRIYELFRIHRFNVAITIMKMLKKKKIKNINFWERKIYSQMGDDGIIEIIFYAIGATNKFFVEIGADETECNTRYLCERKGWNGIIMDCKYDKHAFIKNEFVNAENINDLFKKYDVPKEFDLLSIDIDSNEYWVWKALDYSPRVVVIEYNAIHPPTESKVVIYDPKAIWDKTNYLGASLLALVKLAESKGYTLIGCDSKGVNAYFVRNELIKSHFEIKPIEELYKPPKFGKRVSGVHVGHPPSDKPWVTV